MKQHPSYRYLLSVQPRRQRLEDWSPREEFEWAFFNACLAIACGVVLVLAIMGVLG